MSKMTVETHEGEFLAAYLKFTENPVGETQEVCDGVNVDLDEGGGLIGIEVFSLLDAPALAMVRGLVDKHNIKERFQVDVLACTLILYDTEGDNGNDSL